MGLGRVRAGASRVPALPAVARVVAALALVTGLAACSNAGASGAPIPAAVVASEADCLAPQVLDQLGLTLDPSLAARAMHTAAPAAGRVPDGFVPTSVLVCQVGGQMRDSAGSWTAVTATSREGSGADVSAVVAALTRSAGSNAPAPASSCAPGDPRVVLWLLDATDRAVLPHLVPDACGGLNAAVRSAVDRLPVTGEVDHPVQLMAPARS